MKVWRLSAIFAVLAVGLPIWAAAPFNNLKVLEIANSKDLSAVAMEMKSGDIFWTGIEGGKASVDNMKKSNDSSIKIGWGMEQFEVPEGHSLSGYPNPENRLAQQAYAPLEVNALFLERNGVKAMLVSVDALGLAREQVQDIKDEICGRTGIDPEGIFISCTHTHSAGTGTALNNSASLDDAFVSAVTSAIYKAAENASKSLQPATVKVVSGEVSLGHNRRVVENGKAENVWSDPDRKHTGPVDDEVGILSFQDENDNILALLLNYSCHPVALGPKNVHPSADFPGYARDKLRQSLGDIPIVYTNGAGGDINPLDGLKETPAVARAMGEELADSVLEVLPLAKPVDLPELKLRSKEDTFIRKRDQEPRATQFQLLALGDEVAFISLPGEPLVEIGLQLKALSRYPKTYILGYTNDYVSYLVTKKAVREGGYEARISFNDEIEDYIMSLGESWLGAPGRE